MVQEKFSEVFWKSVDRVYSNNHREGIKLKELLEIMIKCQKKLRNKKVEFENMPPYHFQLTSTFKKATLLDEKKLQITVNWHSKKRVGAEFDLKTLDVLVNGKYIILQDRKKYMAKKIIIFLSK